MVRGSTRSVENTCLAHHVRAGTSFNRLTMNGLRKELAKRSGWKKGRGEEGES